MGWCYVLADTGGRNMNFYVTLCCFGVENKYKSSAILCLFYELGTGYI